MRKILYTKQFKKDFKRLKKRGYKMHVLNDLISKLFSENTLSKIYKDHPLSGKHKGFRECHIQPDWLLIYFKDKEKLILTLTRTGTHSDLFDM
jgi:mRNA interferase YafQ